LNSGKVGVALLGAALICGVPVFGADTSALGGANPENFRVEVTGSAWIMDSGGTLHSGGTFIDLRSDLGFEQEKPVFWGKLTFKPGRKHRIFVEGSPLGGDGLHTINRSITYNGQVFNVSETVQSNVSLNTLFVGYQYDVLSGSYGHLGVSGAGAYLDGMGTLTSLNPATTSTGDYKIGLPLAGVDFRVFPIPSHSWLAVDGSIRGMDFGSYGHYVEGGVNLSVWIANHISVSGGYKEISAQLQDSQSATGSGLKIMLRGPIVSMGFKW
jgi:hypothetical protein